MQIERADVVKTYKKFSADLLRNPDDKSALINQLALLLDNGDRKNAPHYLCLARRAWRNAPNDTAAIFNLASALHRVGAWRQSAQFYQQCLDDPEWHARSLHHLGRLLPGAGREQEGDRLLRQGAASCCRNVSTSRKTLRWRYWPMASSCKDWKPSKCARTSPTRS